MDLTGVIHLFGPPREITVNLKERINEEVGMQSSIGLGPNKLIAKMAAGVQKPNGLTLVESLDEYKKILWADASKKAF